MLECENDFEENEKSVYVMWADFLLLDLSCFNVEQNMK